eukprot:scaffold88187_cov35-Attheya_sp.AAC.2
MPAPHRFTSLLAASTPFRERFADGVNTLSRNTMRKSSTYLHETAAPVSFASIAAWTQSTFTEPGVSLSRHQIKNDLRAYGPGITPKRKPRGQSKQEAVKTTPKELTGADKRSNEVGSIELVSPPSLRHDHSRYRMTDNINSESHDDATTSRQLGIIFNEVNTVEQAVPSGALVLLQSRKWRSTVRGLSCNCKHSLDLCSRRTSTLTTA